jgi:hypothetical protein
MTEAIIETKKPNKATQRPFYVSNVELYATYVDWYARIAKAKETNSPEPEMPRFIAESMMKIATKLAYKG